MVVDCASEIRDHALAQPRHEVKAGGGAYGQKERNGDSDQEIAERETMIDGEAERASDTQRRRRRHQKEERRRQGDRPVLGDERQKPTQRAKVPRLFTLRFRRRNIRHQNGAAGRSAFGGSWP